MSIKNVAGLTALHEGKHFKDFLLKNIHSSPQNVSNVASMAGHIEIVKLLDEYGADFNDTDRYGKMPLDYGM